MRVYEKNCFGNSEIQRNMSLKKSYCDKDPQGLVVGPVLFLIYTHNIFLGIESVCKNFAHDRPFVTVADNGTQSQNCVNEEFFVSEPVSGTINGKCFLIPILINKQLPFIFHKNKFNPHISHVLSTTQFKDALLRNATFFIQ